MAAKQQENKRINDNILVIRGPVSNNELRDSNYKIILNKKVKGYFWSNMANSAFYDVYCDYYLSNGANENINGFGSGTTEAIREISDEGGFDFFDNKKYKDDVVDDAHGNISPNKIIYIERDDLNKQYKSIDGLKKKFGQVKGVYHFVPLHNTPNVNKMNTANDNNYADEILTIYYNYRACLVNTERIKKIGSCKKIVHLVQTPGEIFYGGFSTCYGMLLAVEFFFESKNDDIIISLDIEEDKFRNIIYNNTIYKGLIVTMNDIIIKKINESGQDEGHKQLDILTFNGLFQFNKLKKMFSDPKENVAGGFSRIPGSQMVQPAFAPKMEHQGGFSQMVQPAFAPKTVHQGGFSQMVQPAFAPKTEHQGGFSQMVQPAFAPNAGRQGGFIKMNYEYKYKKYKQKYNELLNDLNKKP